MEEPLRKEFSLVVKKYAKDTTPELMKRPALRAIMWERTSGRCWYCGEPMNPFSEFSIDHLVPICDGGTNTYDNLVPCCRMCNAVKRGLGMDAFRARMASRRLPLFSEEQRHYLESLGVDIELPTVADYAFYFEREGLR